MSALFVSLKNRGFRVIWATEAFSFIGNFVHLTAQAWVVLQITDSPMALGRLSVAYWLPPALLSLYGGVLADRLPPRSILVATQLASAAIAMVLAVLTFTERIELWQLYALAAIRGGVMAFELPAYSVFMVNLVGPEVLPNAMALNASTFSVARVAGTAIGGLAIAHLGSAGAFLFNALSFLPCAAAYAFLRLSGQTPPSTRRVSLMVRLREGLTYTRRSARISTLVALGFFVALFCDNNGVVVPMVAEHLMRASPEAFGIMTSCVGAGSMAGAALMARTRKPSMVMSFGSAILLAGLLALLGISRWYLVTCAILVLSGMAAMVFIISNSALVTTTASQELRGRVSSIRLVLGSIAAPCGGYLTGALATSLGVRFSLVTLGGLCLVGIAIAYLVGLLARRREQGV